MNVYMLEDKATGLFYRRQSWPRWVEQKKASIWTSRPGQALAYVSNRGKKQAVIRSFKLEPNDE